MATPHTLMSVNDIEDAFRDIDHPAELRWDFYTKTGLQKLFNFIPGQYDPTEFGFIRPLEFPLESADLCGEATKAEIPQAYTRKIKKNEIGFHKKICVGEDEYMNSLLRKSYNFNTHKNDFLVQSTIENYAKMLPEHIGILAFLGHKTIASEVSELKSGTEKHFNIIRQGLIHEGLELSQNPLYEKNYIKIDKNTASTNRNVLESDYAYNLFTEMIRKKMWLGNASSLKTIYCSMSLFNNLNDYLDKKQSDGDFRGVEDIRNTDHEYSVMFRNHRIIGVPLYDRTIETYFRGNDGTDEPFNRHFAILTEDKMGTIYLENKPNETNFLVKRMEDLINTFRFLWLDYMDTALMMNRIIFAS